MNDKFVFKKVVITYGEEGVLQFNNFSQAVAFYELVKVMPINVALGVAEIAFRIWVLTPDAKCIRKVAETLGDAITIFNINAENYDKLSRYVKKNY